MPGGFLTSVITNDLFGAVARADRANKEVLPQIVEYVYWNVPGVALYSEENMEAFCERVCAEKAKAKE